MLYSFYASLTHYIKSLKNDQLADLQSYGFLAVGATGDIVASSGTRVTTIG